jgi:hypothetical protein
MDALRKLVLVGALVAFVAFSQEAAAGAFSKAEIVGTRCAKAGLTRSVGGVSYVCAKSGRTTQWRRAASPTAKRGSGSTSGATTTTVVSPLTAAEVVAAKINTFVAPMRTRNQQIPVIEYRFGPSVSEADRALTRQLAEAFFRYGSFPQLSNYRNAISVSTSNAEVVETTAPWQNVSQWGNIAGGYTGTGTYSLVVQNLTAHRCGTGVTPENCAARDNGGVQGRFKTRVNILHEFSHGGKVAVMGYDPSKVNNALDRLPMWLASGISNVQGAMLLAVIDDTVYSNFNISASEGLRCRNVPISANSIADVHGEGGWGCKGSGTGDFANEVLVARFGLDKVIGFIAELGASPLKSTWSDWSSVWSVPFQRTFLQTPASFERDVETYRDAVMNGKNLPADFLEAKARP